MSGGRGRWSLGWAPVAGLLLAGLAAGTAGAQLVAGPWVEQAEARVEKFRKVGVRVLVLDREGNPVPGAVVRVEQLNHGFPIGFVVPADGFPAAYRADGRLWRCFNAVSLDRLGGWAALEPAGADRPDLTAVDEAVAAAEARGLAVSWGPVLPGDAAKLPGRLARAEGRDLLEGLTAHLDLVVGSFGRRVAAWDVCGDAMDRDLVGDALGPAVLRRLVDRVAVLAPGTRRRLRLDAVMDRRRSLVAVKKVAGWNEAVIGFDGLAVGQRFAGRVEAPAVQLPLSRLEAMGLPLVFGPVEVVSEQPLEAALSLEVVLRLLFAGERTAGIVLGGLTPGEAAVPDAALVDGEGRLTAVGQVVDRLFAEQWWTDVTGRADALANFETRVFPGVYRLSATWGKGGAAVSLVRVGIEDDRRLWVVQPDGVGP